MIGIRWLQSTRTLLWGIHWVGIKQVGFFGWEFFRGGFTKWEFEGLGILQVGIHPVVIDHGGIHQGASGVQRENFPYTESR